MVEIHADGDRVEVEVRGWHQVWAMKRRIAFPRTAVRGARRLPADALRGAWKGWRVPGTHLPGIIVAGTFYKDGERQFWDVRHADRGIEIELAGQPYDRLFVEVADPDAALRALRA
jgi:hypothetical protein